MPAWSSDSRPGRVLGSGRAVPAVVLAAALAAAAAACGSPSSSGKSASGTTTSSPTASVSASASASPAGTRTLTGAAATALMTKAVADTEAAPTVMVKATGLPGGTAGQPISFDLTLVQKAGCEGTFGQSKTETFQLVVRDGYTWMKASSAFLTSINLTQADIGLIDGRWIKIKSTDAQTGSFSQLCDLSSLLGSLKPTGTGWVATPTTYEGRSVYEIIQSGTPGYGYVTNSATPMLVGAEDPSKSGGDLTFTESSTPLTITEPSAAESIDGSGLGF
jgi:hypothetical protein